MIEFKDVHKWFGELHVLNGISLKVAPAEVLVVCGPSGSGKSTLIRCINRLETIQKGELVVDGMKVHDSKTNMTKLRAEIGFVFQQFNLYPHMTALQNVTLAPMKVRKTPRKDAEDQGRYCLEKVGLGDKLNQYPAQLSGGQQQRVAIARSLVLKPQIILMDEPFSALDEPTRLEMQRLIMDLWHEVEATVLIVTHSIAEAVYLGDRVWVMAAGPGRIAHEFKDTIPKTRGADPLAVQETAAFKRAVAEVGEAFRKVDVRK
jgi:polar amino acid transport system ATP-binding protein